MKAIILGAAKSSISDRSISNIEILDQRLIDVQISCLRNAGIENIAYVGGYKSEEIERNDVNIFYNRSWESTGSVGSLKCSVDVIDESEDILVIYGDTLFEPILIKEIVNSEGGFSIICFLDRENRDLGVYREYAIIKDGGVDCIVSDPSRDNLRTVFTGMLFIKKHKIRPLIKHLELSSDGEHIGALINSLISSGVDILPIIVESGWTEITTEDMYASLLSEKILLESVIQIHTDWTHRATGYNKLDWVNNDKLLRKINDIALDFKPKTILDVGTGTGKVLFALKETLGEGEFWGVDYSSAMLDKIDNEDGSLRLHCQDAELLSDIPDNYFDLVTARMVFHHLKNPILAIRNICRVLKKGGRLLICEGVPPSIRSIEWYTDMFRYKEDRNTITEVDLVNYLSGGGLDQVTTHTVVMKNASLNNWLDNSGIPERNIEIIKEMHHKSPDYIVEDYEMRYLENDCLMTWRFAVTHGVKP